MRHKFETHLLPEKTYHVWTKSNGSENLFLCHENYRFFLEKFQHYITPVASTFAYCLMPNHIHFMIELHDERRLLKYFRHQKEDEKVTFSDLVIGKNKKNRTESVSTTGASVFISKQFSNLFNSYTKSFNKVYERKGSLFQRPFRRKEVASPDYYADLITYIHRNPIQHGFVQQVDEWPFSSFNSIKATKQTKLQRETVLGWFENREKFIQAHR